MKKTATKRRSGPVRALAFGSGLALSLTMILTAILAYAMESEWIGESAMGYVAGGILLFATIAGACLTVALCPQRRMLLCLGTGGAYLVFLFVMGALFFQSDFSGFPVTVLLVCGGSAAAGLLKSGGRKKSYRRRHG